MRDAFRIGTAKPASPGPASYIGQMARIRRQAQGQPAVVVLNDLDRELLAQALDSYVYTSGKSAATVAKELGVARPYLYRLISAGHIEIERLIKLQNLLGIYLLREREVEEYVDDLRSELLGRPLEESCFRESPTIEVSLYYVANYLLSDLKGQALSISEIGHEWRERRLTFEFAWEDSSYHLLKLYEYCSRIVNVLNVGALPARGMEDDRCTDDELTIELPVVGVSDYWEDFKERVTELLSSTYDDMSKDATIFEGLEGLGEDEMVPWVKEMRDQEIEYHEQFCDKMLAKIVELESDVERIEHLCETRERALRRTSYRLSELHEVAENLEANSFLLTPKHKKRIVEWLSTKQPSIELLSEDNWWARRSEFKCKKCGAVYSTNFRYLAEDIGPCRCRDERILKALKSQE